MNTIHRIAATAVTTAAVLMSTGVAAHAQSATIKDKASDVVAFSSEDTDENGTLLDYQGSLDSGADIRSMKVKHTKKSVSVTLKFAELDRDPTITVAFKIPGKSQPQRFLMNVTSRAKADVYDAKDKRICRVPLTIKPGAQGSVKAVVKRSCLGTPKKIKVAAVAATVQVDGTSYVVKQDAVSATNVRTPSWTKWLKAS